jgi:hypothetical protein
VAEITVVGNWFRFVIRDENGISPSIHGSKKSIEETETEVRAVLDRLSVQDPVA